MSTRLVRVVERFEVIAVDVSGERGELWSDCDEMLAAHGELFHYLGVREVAFRPAR